MAAILLAALILGRAPARAATGCTFAAGTVAVTLPAAGDGAVISRTAAGVIQVGGAGCGGATVTNTDRITVTAGAGLQAVTINPANGGFAPGATAEASGTSEIEFEIDLGTGGESTNLQDIVTVEGTAAADTYRLGTAGINLNGDNDVDITGPAGGLTTTMHAERFDVNGLAGNDVISGAVSAETGGAFPISVALRLFGGVGDDQLTGGDSANTLTGGAGNDTETGGNGPDIFDEEAAANGNDTFIGNSSPYDTVDYSKRTLGVNVDTDNVADDGQPGAETDNAHDDVEIVFGGAGDDTIADNSAVFRTRTFEGGNGNDTITGGTAGDNLYGQAGNDTIHGGPQGDYIYGGQGDDQMFGDSGLDAFWEDQDLNNPTVTQPNGADEIFGGTEEDSVNYRTRQTAIVVTLADNLPNDGADTTPGGAAEEGDNIHDDVEDVAGASGGVDRLTGNALANQLQGGSFDDTIDGLAGNDRLNGDPGIDTIHGGPDNDTVDGGVGNDLVFGDAGDDSVSGSFDNDTIDGGPGNDTENGNTGNDLFVQSAAANGNDKLDGSFDTDTVSYANRSTRVVVTLDGVANDGDPAAGEVDNALNDENIIGGTGNDSLTGNASANAITGNGGNDTMVGLDSNDTMDGGLGTDSFEGDLGTDTATYAARSARMVVTIDGTANDGDPNANGGAGEQDNVKTDVENLIGGSGNDSLTGSPSPNLIVGGAGADTIAGLAGDDVESGGDGNDTFSEGATANGADDISGGNDTGGVGDLVTYEQRNVSVRVSLDDLSPDGADTDGNGTADENDNVHSDVESVRGGTRGDTLTGDDFANQLSGLGGNDTLDGKLGPDVLSGGANIDTVTYASRTDNVVVQLDDVANDGADTDHDNQPDEGDNVKSDVENAIGGNGSDVFIGSALANRFTGGAGSDFFIGQDGPDVYQGGAGYDVADYSDRTQRVAVSIDGVANDGTDADLDNIGEEGDNVLTDIEAVYGGSGNDLLVASDDGVTNESLKGSGGDDVLRGLGGADTLTGGAGNDVLEGGTGIDTAVYDDHTTAVTVTLDDVANDGDPTIPETDNAKSDIENIAGGSGNDTLIGNSSANVLVGGSGNDHMDGQGGNDQLQGQDGDDFLIGGPGADQLLGQNGVDTASYAAASTPLSVTLDGSANDGTAGEGDNAQVENVLGGTAGDVITGNASANRLDGGAGNDVLTGLGGDDTFIGGDGADTESGGPGDDIFHEDGQSGSGGLPDGPDDIHGGAGAADIDTVDYSQRTQNLKINIDDAANDGATDVAFSEGDNVHTDVEQVIGGSGNDDIQAGNSNTTLFGEDGNDDLKGGEGDDILWGGEGNDKLTGGLAEVLQIDGNDQLHGENGDDTLDGGNEADLIDCGPGDDVCGDSGKVQHSPFGPNVINGGPGNDNMVGSGQSDTISGGDGDDQIVGDPESEIDSGIADTIHGDAGNDTIDGRAGDDTIDGGLGDDNISGGSDDDTIDGGAGNDMLLGGVSDPAPLGFRHDGNDVMTGGSGSDQMNGGPGNDTLDGGAGMDFMSGGSNDITDTTDGADILHGGAANDIMDGGRNGDQLFGDAGNDTMDGGLECDLLDGGTGADSMDGGAGVQCDAVVYTSRTAHVSVTLDTVANDGEAGEGDNVQRFVRILGGAGNDTLTGDSGFNELCGGAGNDTLDGGVGDDALIGEAGDDTLLGGDGNDNLGQVAAAIVPGSECAPNDLGSDTMQGQEGNDTFFAADGIKDFLFGGNGTDAASTFDAIDAQDSIP